MSDCAPASQEAESQTIWDALDLWTEKHRWIGETKWFRLRRGRLDEKRTPFMSQTSNLNLQSLVANPWLSCAADALIRFISSCRESSSVALVHHGDVDGVVGASYVAAAIAKLRPDLALKAYVVSTAEYDFVDLANWSLHAQADYGIILDLSIANKAEMLERVALTLSAGVFIYDHHALNDQGFAPPAGVQFFNPVAPMGDPEERNSATFSLGWTLAEKSGLVFPDELLLLSIFAEGVDHVFAEVVELLAARTPNFPREGAARRRYSQWPPARVSMLIRAAFSNEQPPSLPRDCLTRLALGLTSFGEVQKVLEAAYGEAADNVGTAISSAVEKWKKELGGSDHPNAPLIVIPVYTSPAAAGPIASILRGAFPDLVFLTWVRWKERAMFEVRSRNGGRVHLVEALRAISGSVTLFNYGGHPSAAGGALAEQDIDLFAGLLKQAIEAQLAGPIQ